MKKVKLPNLQAAFHRAEKGMVLTKEGNGGYGLDFDLRPVKPRSPAQQQAIHKAGQASALKRKLT